MKAASVFKASALIVLLSALSACGRAGPLEPPPSSVADNSSTTDASETVEDKPFVLDGLLN